MNCADQSSTPLLSRMSDYVVHYSRTTPNAEALVIGEQRINYQEFDAAVTRCARALVRAGVERGDRVATLSPPHPDFIISLMAVASIGAIWVGLNPKYTFPELQYVVGDAEPCLLLARITIGERNYREEIERLVADSRSLKSVVVLGDEAAALPADWQTNRSFLAAGEAISDETLAARRTAVTGDDPMVIVYTSGTTGKPKGALITHHGLVKCARVQRYYWDADPVRIQNFLPVNHIGSIGDISCYAIVSGGAIIFMEKFDALESMENAVSEKITLWGGIPTTLQMSLDLPDFPTFDLSHVQIIAWSGAAAPASLVRRLREITPRLSNAYGQTETVGSISFVAPCDDVETLSNTVGKPVPDYEVRIDGGDGDDDANSAEGEILVRGDFIMKGYWRNPEATSETIDQDGWLHTGDIGRMRPDGYLELIGRKTEMFKSGGYNIYPREIEVVLEGHPLVLMAAVIDVPDALYGEVGHAFILVDPEQAPDEETLRLFCRDSLADYKIPKKFFVRSELPLLPVGKIDKRALRNEPSG